MVGLSDIPCLGKIVDRVSDAMVDPLFRGFDYMFCYKDSVNFLDSEIRKLGNHEGRVSRRTDAEKNNGKTIDMDVSKWQQEVKEIQRSTEEFLEKYRNRSSWRCIYCLPIPKPVSRFKLGREAVQMAKRVSGLYDSGKGYLENDIAFLPPIENVPASDTEFKEFKSRKDSYDKLWEALVSEDGSMILGIYGMPGVGKTRMMEQLWQEVKEKKIFDKAARADVGSEELNVIKLQNQIAGHLDCHFQSQDDKKHRANQLKHSLLNGGKILILLDDVWSQIPLIEIIGVSFAEGSSSKGLKILMTSRKKYVCLDNNCEHPIEITTLTTGEAWDLFKHTVGPEKIHALQDESLVQEVCNKCHGLPLLIHTVGKALKCRPHSLWKDALYQLENGKVEKIAEIDPRVYVCVKLSIDKLEEDAKSCLLLCSLFPEDANIHIRELILLATGSLVPDGESRICAMVDILKSSCLLLDCQEDHTIKLHDLIRDVARSVAVSDPKYAFKIVKCCSRLPDDTDYCTRKFMHLQLEDSDLHFPGDLCCPDLRNLWLQCLNNVIPKFSGSFLSNLRFLWIQEGTSYYVKPENSIQCLGKLRTLILDDCYMADINKNNVRFFPESLESLCIRNCRMPLLMKLPDLKYLRKLEIKTLFGSEVRMVPNAISSLRSLEELHVPHGIQILDQSCLEELFGSETDMDGSDISLNGSDIFLDGAPLLAEISKLTNLRSLQMFFSDFEHFHCSDMFVNLLEYNIWVGNQNKAWGTTEDQSVPFKRSITLMGNQIEGFGSLIERAELLKLYCTDINVGSIYDSNREAFADLRCISIRRSSSMEYLARMSQGEIQHSCQPLTSFSKLTKLQICEAYEMKYLFSKSVAKCLVQLQEVYIFDCPLMEAIIKNEQDTSNEGDIINFFKLKSLKLLRLPRLESFYGEEKEMQHSSSTSIMDDSAAIPLVQSLPLFDGRVAFPFLEVLEVCELEEISDIWGNHFCNENVSTSFCNVKRLVVDGCNIIETVFPQAISSRLQNLECLEVNDCNRLRNVFQHSCITRDLINVKTTYEVNCTMTREIIEAGEQDEFTNVIVYPELAYLVLTNLPSLTSFWSHQNGEANAYKLQLSLHPQFPAFCLLSVFIVGLPDALFRWFLYGFIYKGLVKVLNSSVSSSAKAERVTKLSDSAEDLLSERDCLSSTS
ncbi:hypothetical protein ACET3Z_011417 [Daucus carota]